MRKSLAQALAFAALAMLGAASRAQIADNPNNAPNPPSPPSPPHHVLTLPCCKCLGENTTINLNTGQGLIDSHWRVNGGPAFTTPPFPGWMPPMLPARWIQPVANPKPSGNVPPGVYNYTLQFNVPKCTIPGTARITGRLAADNSVRGFLDATLIPTTVCGTGFCFRPPDAPKAFVIPNIAPGVHTLRFEVRNLPPGATASGLMVNAQLRRDCQKD